MPRVCGRLPLRRAALAGADNRRRNAYFTPMRGRNAVRGILAKAALVVPLLAILVAAFWFAARAWTALSGPPMPAFGYLALGLGTVFSLVVGCGLMALLFYSSRHGYDEPFQAGEWQEPAEPDTPDERQRPREPHPPHPP
jgi:hypothetical protein